MLEPSGAPATRTTGSIMPRFAVRARPTLLLPLLASVALGACGDAPSAPHSTTPLRLCTDAEFVAYRNEGAAWRPAPVKGGIAEFDATTRVAIARAWGDRAIPYLVVDYVSADQAKQAAGCAGPSAPAPMVATGVVRPWDGVGEVQVGYGGRSWLHWGADSTFGVQAVTGPSDLVAVRGSWSNARYVERIILRRAQAYAAGSRVVLDFGAGDAFAPESAAVRYDGPHGGVLVEFRTATGDRVTTYSTSVGDVGDPVLPRVVPIFGVPAARTVPGDLHLVHVEDFTLGDRRRMVDLWTRTLPLDLALPYGPIAQAPELRETPVSPTTAWVRVDAALAAQPEYGAALTLLYDQSSFRPSGSMTRISVTREYFGGTPVTWRIPFPDLYDLEGFPLNAGLTTGGLRWSLTLTGRPGLAHVPVTPADGQLFRSATVEGIHR